MSTALRLGLYYAALFIGNGASGPYASVWFHAHGLSGAAIGLILAAPPLGRVLTGPGLAVWADGFKVRRTPIAVLAAVMAIVYASLALAHGFWAWLAIWFAAQSLNANSSPLADVIALRRARAEGFNYGWPRGMGSVAYIAGAVGMGLVLGVASPNALIVWICGSALAAAVAAAWLLPRDRVHETDARLRKRDRLKGMAELLSNPTFALAIVSAALIQASHGFYNGFSVLTWERQGLPAGLTGLLWGVAVAAEVGFLWFMEPWRRRLGPARLLVLGGAGAVIRWTCLSLSPPLWLLFPLQALHALSFTATFVGSIQLVDRLAPARSASLAQTLNGVLTGLLMGLTTMASGRLFDAVGAHGYLAMAGVALAGLIGAVRLASWQRARAAAALGDRA